MQIIDSHIHLVAKRFMKRLLERDAPENPTMFKKQMARWARALKRRGQVERDDSFDPEPAELARLWLDELDRSGVRAGVFFAFGGEETDEEAAEFARVAPDRLLIYMILNPVEAASVERLRRGIDELGFRGIKLLPPNFRFSVADRRAWPVYELCEERGVPVLSHMGISIGYNSDIRYSNPLDIHPAAVDFPDLTFIAAHFGAGFLREVLFMAYQCENVCVDSSGSNSWRGYMPYPISLADTFRRVLDCYGPDRVLFGSDSSYWPRGFRRDVLDEQLAALDEIDAPDETRRKFLGENAARILRLDGGA